MQDRDAFAALAGGCTKMFVDINGNRDPRALADLLAFVRSHIRPEVVVVKSSKLYRYKTPPIDGVRRSGLRNIRAQM
eukprot:1182080-Prorocentrum_minimum.AAC.3